MLSTVVPVHHVLLLVWNIISTHQLSIDSHYNQKEIVSVYFTSAARLLHVGMTPIQNSSYFRNYRMYLCCLNTEHTRYGNSQLLS